MIDELFTPTERIVLLALDLHPTRTYDELEKATGTRTKKYLRNSLRTLTIGGLIDLVPDVTTPTYRKLVSK